MNIEINFLKLVEATGKTKQAILSRRRTADLVNDRQHIAMRLHEMGYSLESIARVMNRDRSSIYNLCHYRKIK
jgi:hypothetical protein